MITLMENTYPNISPPPPLPALSPARPTPDPPLRARGARLPVLLLLTQVWAQAWAQGCVCRAGGDSIARAGEGDEAAAATGEGVPATSNEAAADLLRPVLMRLAAR